MDYFKYLPQEITSEILSRVVPSESVLECKLVCKSWRNIVSHDPSFFRRHLDHTSTAEDSCKLGFLALTDNGFYYFEYNDELTPSIDSNRKMITATTQGTCFVGSCNGLICLVRDQSNPVCRPNRPVGICNPFTKEFLVLPEIRIGLFHKEYVRWAFGFGYISLTGDYKVVGICVSRSEYVEVFIYTLGSGNGWRNLGKFNSEFRPDHLNRQHGKFANGAIYWVGVKDYDRILTFGLNQEMFCAHLAPPPLPEYTDLIHHTVGVLDGLLYIVTWDEGERDDPFETWLLKKKNDHRDKKEGKNHQSLSWCKEFKVGQRELLAITKSGGVLSYTAYDVDLNIYNTKASTSKRLLKFEADICRVFPHKNTFVSLKLLGEEDAKTMKFGKNQKQ